MRQVNVIVAYDKAERAMMVYSGRYTVGGAILGSGMVFDTLYAAEQQKAKLEKAADAERFVYQIATMWV